MTDLPSLKDAVLEVDGRVAVLTFNRDDVRNALTSTELVAEIPRVIAWANAEPDISVLILTGAGSAFSAGGNIKTMGERAKAAPHVLEQNYRHGVQRIPLALERAEIPVIAAKPPQAIRYAKRLLKLGQRQNLEEHLEVCSAFQAICHKTEDHAEALAAFFEKRQGNFKGK